MTLFDATTESLDVTLFMLSGSSLMTLASVLDTMRAANRLAEQALFRWRLVSVDGAAIHLSCGLCLPADAGLDKLSGGGLLMIIAGLNQDPRVTP